MADDSQVEQTMRMHLKVSKEHGVSINGRPVDCVASIEVLMSREDGKIVLAMEQDTPHDLDVVGATVYLKLQGRTFRVVEEAP